MNKETIAMIKQILEAEESLDKLREKENYEKNQHFPKEKPLKPPLTIPNGIRKTEAPKATTKVPNITKKTLNTCLIIFFVLSLILTIIFYSPF